MFRRDRLGEVASLDRLADAARRLLGEYSQHYDRYGRCDCEGDKQRCERCAPLVWLENVYGELSCRAGHLAANDPERN